MKYRKLTVSAAFLLTLVVMLAIFLFKKISNSTNFTEERYLLFTSFSAVFIFILNYFLLLFLLRFYGTKQIKEISTILPFELTDNQNEELTFKTFNEKVAELTQRRETEMDTLLEMESYRREYVGNISHELKTPLFSIQGYLDILVDGGVENLNIRDKYLHRIDQCVERLLNIVKDLDMINQYEAGEISLQYTSFDINELITEIIEMLEVEAEQKLAVLKLITVQNKLMVTADRQKISQILINLISNAIYYSNREEAQITVFTYILKNLVFVEVQDNGMGIKPAVLPRIFERFYRVESSRNRREGGSGLGLAIVKHILEAHHQKIYVESIYLEGTKFTFTLEKDGAI